jgi:hypothetical protein
MTYDEPTVVDLIRDVWKAKLPIVVCGLVTFGLAFAYVQLATPVYEGRMIIAPADGYALGDYASQNSSSSYNHGVSLPFWRPTDPEGVSTDYYRFINTLDGASVASILLRDTGVLTGIGKEADDFKVGNTWEPEELAAYLHKKINVEFLGATPLRRITYTHPDRAFASAFLRKVHLVADQMIRRDRKRQAEARISYLTQALSNTQNPDHRKIITNLLMQQEHVRMLANLDEAYAAIIVEPASSSVKPVWPNKKMIYPVSLLVGAFLGFLLWSLRQDTKSA